MLFKRSTGPALLVTTALVLTACEYGPSLSEHASAVPFEGLPVGFTHVWEEPSHPFTGAAVMDVNGDGQDEVFVGGGRAQADALLFFENGALVDRIKGTGLDDKTGATHGMVSTDADQDGDVDLFVTRDSGLFFYENQGGRFAGRSIPLTLEPDAVPLSVAAGDIDQDGDVDLYISAFVAFPAFQSATFNDPTHAKRNVLLTNRGDMTFDDTTETAGVAGLQNTFHSAFVNLDGDNDLDLVLAQNTGEIEIFENQGDATFKAHPTASGYGFWMGLGIGDMDQDGDQDILVSNAGTSIPAFLTTGDIRDDQRHNITWALMRNDGGFGFSDVVAEREMDGYGFGWGAVFEDLNQDGAVDALIAQNYIKWPVHNVLPLDGKSLLQLDDGDAERFFQVDSLSLQNPHYGQSPLIADLNGDGRPDVLWLNMDGPMSAHLNRSTGPFLSLRLPDDPLAQGADVTVTLSDGSKLHRQAIASTGLMTDQTAVLFFGLRGDQTVETVKIAPLGRAPITLTNPPLNTTVPVSF